MLLMLVDDRRAITHQTVDRSHGRISDGQVDPQPTLMPSPDTHHTEIGGIEDPRNSYVEAQPQWDSSYTAYSQAGPLVPLATTTDFRTFERHGVVMPPEDKDAALYPVRFDGRWAMLHRPVSHMPTGAHLWLSFSADLKHWGDHQILLRA